MAMPESNAVKAPSTDSISAAWKQADKEDAYWRRHREALLAKYPDKFVAVHKSRVIAASENLTDVLTVLQTKSISLRMAWIKFITANPRHTLL